MIKQKSQIVAFILYITMVLAGCKSCEDAEISCKECLSSEMCSNGICVCKEGYEKLYETCVQSKNSFQKRNYNAYILQNACFTFDSTIMAIPNQINLTDTSAITIIPDGHVAFYKTYGFALNSFPSEAYIATNSAFIYKDNNGIGIKFTLGENSFYPPTFRPLAEFGDTVYWTKWDARFNDNLSKLTAKVVLLVDKDLNNYAETPVDSCVFEYMKW